MIDTHKEEIYHPLTSEAFSPLVKIEYRAEKISLYVVARMLQQVEAEVINNSRSKLHQTTYKEIFSAL